MTMSDFQSEYQEETISRLLSYAQNERDITSIRWLEALVEASYGVIDALNNEILLERVMELGALLPIRREP